MTDGGTTDYNEANFFTDGQCPVAHVSPLYILRGLQALHIEFGARA
jgi:hypothetical protein